jgi:hypothetical protein
VAGLILAGLTGCGVGGASSGGDTGSDGTYTGDYTVTSNNDISANPADVKVVVDANNTGIHFYPYNLENWGIFYLGTEKSIPDNGVYYDYPIGVVPDNMPTRIDCVIDADENDTNSSYLTYSCSDTFEYSTYQSEEYYYGSGVYDDNDSDSGGGIEYVDNDDGTIYNILYIYKNVPTYVYERSVLNDTAYVVGEFDYENGKVVYVPYKEFKPIQVNDLVEFGYGGDENDY